jgi:RNA polymerase sigma factor (sigma-70 family)
MGEHVAAVNGPSEGLQASLTFEELFESERGRLFRALLLVTHDSMEAEDLMQEAFVRVWERWDRIGQIDDPVGYLYKTALNLYRSALRRALTAAKRSVRPPTGRDPLDEVSARDEAVRSLAALTGEILSMRYPPVTRRFVRSPPLRRGSEPPSWSPSSSAGASSECDDSGCGLRACSSARCRMQLPWGPSPN